MLLPSKHSKALHIFLGKHFKNYRLSNNQKKKREDLCLAVWGGPGGQRGFSCCSKLGQLCKKELGAESRPSGGTNTQSHIGFCWRRLTAGGDVFITSGIKKWIFRMEPHLLSVHFIVILTDMVWQLLVSQSVGLL